MDPSKTSPTIRREDALWILRRMRLIRQASERIAALYPTDVMETPVHLCIGQEAVSVGLCRHLEDTDKLFLGHRTHGPALAKGLPLPKLMAELYGRTTGCSHAITTSASAEIISERDIITSFVRESAPAVSGDGAIEWMNRHGVKD